MKITPIFPSKSVQNKGINSNFIKACKNEINITNPNKMFRVYFGKDLVNTQKSGFQSTVDKNYYHLKKGFYPDEFQINAGRRIYEGKDVLAEAPTGIGKTALAYYAASKNMEEGKKTFYTTPLKALSNQKLKEFREIFGEENVGILTGDRKENSDAPIIVMTTEVYRNIAMSDNFKHDNPIMKDLGTVVLDEFHYLGDDSRGPVWEESVMFTPKDTQILALSATIGNAPKLEEWISNIRGNNASLVSVAPKDRPVPLEFNTLETESYKKTGKKSYKYMGMNEAEEMKEILSAKSSSHSTPRYKDYLMALAKLKQNDQLPAIFFVFSKNNSRGILDFFGKEGSDLNTKDEKDEIKKILNEYKSKYYLGKDFNEEALLKGYAIHNAGIMPRQKELVEELFQKKLIKAVISTETLSAGINMPARTVVISSPYKPAEMPSDRRQSNITGDYDYTEINDYEDDDENEIITVGSKIISRPLTANEFIQMSGRAGRRGIDKTGYVYTMPVDYETDKLFSYLKSQPSNSITSKYDPTYSFLCEYYSNLSDKEHLEEIFKKSLFMQEDQKTDLFYPRLTEGAEDIYLDTGFLKYDKNGKVIPTDKTKLLYISSFADALSSVLAEYGYLENTNDFGYKATVKGQMAAKVAGYEPIPLVEVLSNPQAFKNITPEALVMLAGAIGVQDNDKYSVYKVDGDNLSEDSVKYASEMRDEITLELKRKLSVMLRDLGKTFDDFDSFSDMLKYAENLEKTDKDLGELKSQINEIEEIRAKLYKIDSNTKYTLTQLYSAFETGEIIPSKALNYWKSEIQNYKNKNMIFSFDDYLVKLKRNLDRIDLTSKAKKAQARNKKEAEEIKNEIKTVKLMKYIEEHLDSAIKSNQQYKKTNSMANVKADHQEVMSLYTANSLKDKLISTIKALIEIEENPDDEISIGDNAKNNIDSIFRYMLLMSKLLYSEESICGIQGELPMYSENAGKLLYTWAALNKVNPDSRLNWEKVLKCSKKLETDMEEELEAKSPKDDISIGVLVASSDGSRDIPKNKKKSSQGLYDEGTIFRMVMQTGDLLSQMADIAKIGYDNAVSLAEKDSYKDLTAKIKTAKELIIKDPLI